jgi:hypothetical protein
MKLAHTLIFFFFFWPGNSGIMRNRCFLSEFFYRDFIARILKSTLCGGGGCILLLTSSSSGSLWKVKVTNFNWDYTIASSVNIEKGKQNEENCVEKVISFQQQTNMEKVFDEVVYPEESTLKKMDHGDMKLCTISLQNPNKKTHL